MGNKRLKRNEKGITLVALVITIIILIILATVTTNTIFGNEGLISRAEKAADYQANAEATDSLMMDEAINYIDQIIGNDSGGSITDEEQDIKQQETIDSIETLDDQRYVYYMNYTADYKFDEFLQTGVDDEDGMVEYVSQNLLDGQKIEFEFDAQVACSTFAAKTSEGATLFGRNLDLPNSYNSPALIVRTSAENGRYASLSIAGIEMLVNFKDVSEVKPDDVMRELLIAPYIPFDGINSAGVSIGVLALNNTPINQYDSLKKGITTTTAIRLVLDKAGSVDEAIELLEQYNMHTEGNAYHFQIADASGKSVVVEYINNEMQVIEHNVCTNFYIYHYLRGEPDYDVPTNSKSRYNILVEELNNKGGIITEAEAMSGLEAVSTRGSTKWSVVYNSEDLTMNLASKCSYDESTRIRFSLKE